jgi:hypothetical protein
MRFQDEMMGSFSVQRPEIGDLITFHSGTDSLQYAIVIHRHRTTISPSENEITILNLSTFIIGFIPLSWIEDVICKVEDLIQNHSDSKSRWVSGDVVDAAGQPTGGKIQMNRTIFEAVTNKIREDKQHT